MDKYRCLMLDSQKYGYILMVNYIECGYETQQMATPIGVAICC